MERIREAFERALAVALPPNMRPADLVLERPRSGELGDLAFPCFRVAKALGNPKR